MRKYFWVLTISLLFICAPAYSAEIAPTEIENNGGCYSYLICNTQTVAGDCDVDGDTTGATYVLRTFGRWSRYTFVGNESSNDAYSCSIRANNTGYTTESADFVTISTTPLTNTNEAITLFNVDFHSIWVDCTAITTNVIITVNACPSSR